MCTRACMHFKTRSYYDCPFQTQLLFGRPAEPFDLFALILHLGDTHKDDPCKIVSTPGCFMLTHTHTHTHTSIFPYRRPIRLSARAAGSRDTKILRSTL